MRLQAGDGYFGLNEDRPNSVTVITHFLAALGVHQKQQSGVFPNTLTDIKINTGVRMFSLAVESTSSTCSCSYNLVSLCSIGLEYFSFWIEHNFLGRKRNFQSMGNQRTLFYVWSTSDDEALIFPHLQFWVYIMGDPRCD